MPEPKHNSQPSTGPNDTIFIAYRWISAVEDLCRRAFVPDDMIRMRIEARAPFKEWTPEDIQAQIARAIANRDLLAHRCGRPSATIRWQGHPSDRYNDGPGNYRRRLAAIGAELGALGWLTEPTGHPWRSKATPGPSLDERDSAAEKAAAGWIQ